MCASSALVSRSTYRSGDGQVPRMLPLPSTSFTRLNRGGMHLLLWTVLSALLMVSL